MTLEGRVYNNIDNTCHCPVKNMGRVILAASSALKRSNFYKIKIKNANNSLQNSMHFKVTLDK